MKILHLEDSDADAELIENVLRREWPDLSMWRVYQEDDYEAALRHGGFDLILSDYSLPGFDGLSALAAARQQRPEVPFLFLSGTIGEERAVEALKRGATDYILKDRPSRLLAAIRQALAFVSESSRRMRAEESVREQASLLDKARDAIIATNLDLRIMYWNASAERMYGLRAVDVIGRRLDGIGLGYDPGRFAGARAEVLTKGEWRGDFRVQTSRGTAVIVESTWSLVCEPDGRPRSILAIDTDVTERRKLEAQLVRAQRMESIGTLAGGVAHDLNNVLTPILLTIDLLADHANGNEERGLIDQTRASARHGAALVKQLLAFARGADGERKVLDLVAAFGSVEPLIRQCLPASISLTVRHVRPPWPVEANGTQLSQVLVNLALNARDAMPRGGRLEIETDNTLVDPAMAAANPGTEPGLFVRISVSDTGTGIPADILDQIFDPFFTTKPVGKGTGLGLSMVSGILKSHRGFVQVESELGRGTTFHLYFPARQPVSVAPPREPSASNDAAGVGVLLVDDEPAVRETLRLLLQRAGYGIIAAGDARSAMREFEQRRTEIALVITDMMLPDGSGVDVVKRIRASAPRLPIIAISGMMASGNFDELLELQPPVECLAKPLPPRMLLSAAERALSGAVA
ncbi:MAG TPA: response regulator [Opitutaceae bacterium]|nr:response regulator [Opitutaceae bacterium]